MVGMNDSMLTVSQVARRLELSAERIRQLSREGRLLSLNTPLGRLYDRDHVEAFRQARLAAGDGPSVAEPQP
jgi:hypothetical protein